MMIDEVSYNIESYRFQFRFTKKKVLIIATLALLTAALSMGIAHADPSFWMNGPFGAGGRSAFPV